MHGESYGTWCNLLVVLNIVQYPYNSEAGASLQQCCSGKMMMSFLVFCHKCFAGFNSSRNFMVCQHDRDIKRQRRPSPSQSVYSEQTPDVDPSSSLLAVIPARFLVPSNKTGMRNAGLRKVRRRCNSSSDIPSRKPGRSDFSQLPRIRPYTLQPAFAAHRSCGTQCHNGGPPFLTFQVKWVGSARMTYLEKRHPHRASSMVIP